MRAGAEYVRAVRVRELRIQPLDLAIVGTLLVAAELAVAVGSPEGPALAQ
jgi:hypothetical protein